MDTSAQMDMTTEAVIVSATTEQGSSVTTLDRIVNTVGFSYSSDVITLPRFCGHPEQPWAAV